MQMQGLLLLFLYWPPESPLNVPCRSWTLGPLGDLQGTSPGRHVPAGLLLADVFENFRKKCIEIYGLDPSHFLAAPGLAWQACLKKTDVKLELLTHVDMLLMIEKGIRGRICHAIHRYAKANNKYMKNYNKNKGSSYIQYLDANNLYGWEMSQKLPGYGFKLKKIY